MKCKKEAGDRDAADAIRDGGYVVGHGSRPERNEEMKKRIMKKLVTVGMALLLVGMLAACGGESDDGGKSKKDKTQKEETSGSKKDKDSGKGGDSEDGGSGDGQGGIGGGLSILGGGQDVGGDGKLGFRDIHYPMLNPDWTDTDHLAIMDTVSWNSGERVYVLDFGAGSNITKEAGIRDINENNSYGVFGVVSQNNGDLFYLTSLGGDSMELIQVRPDRWVTVNIENDDEIFYVEETSQVVRSSDGSYDIILPEDEYNIGQQYCAVIFPTNGSYPLAVKIRGVEDQDMAEAYFSYIREHMGNYRLKEDYDIATAYDKDGNAVDLSSYAFFTDLLSLDVAERFGLNFKEVRAIKDITRSNLMIQGSDKNWREVQFTGYISLPEGAESTDFMGYKMYYLSDRYIYLEYGEKQYIKFDIRHSIDSEQERKEWLEQEYFSSYVPEE